MLEPSKVQLHNTKVLIKYRYKIRISMTSVSVEKHLHPDMVV